MFGSGGVGVTSVLILIPPFVRIHEDLIKTVTNGKTAFDGCECVIETQVRQNAYLDPESVVFVMADFDGTEKKNRK